ncbi:MAG: hypothetical protein JSS75_13000 [Bacteroidetes bacterium]|nr:hypothetical protein [Bacteroidota bacterium]
MRKTHPFPFRLVAVIAVFAALLSGCDNISSTVDVQDIVELRWQHDGGAIYGLIQKYTLTQYQTGPTAAYNLARFNSDGSLNKTISCDQSAVPDVSYSVFTTPDNSLVATQLGGDLYTINPSTNAYTKRYLQFHLYAVSPDLHYAIGSISPSNRTIRTVVVVDLQTGSAATRTVTSFDVSNLQQQPGLWLGNGQFALTLRDSAGSQVVIYDTTGTLRTTLGGASTAFHNAVYVASTNALYLRNQSGKTTDYSVDKVDLNTMARATVVPIDVESFDISADEGLLVYNHYDLNSDSTKTLAMYARNLHTGVEKQLTRDVLSLVALSPAADRVAYIHARDVNYNEVYTMTVTRP